MVEQRKSLPQAVPSSICRKGKKFKSAKLSLQSLFLQRASSQGSRVSMSSRACSKAPSQDMRQIMFFLLLKTLSCFQSGVERTLLPVKWWTAVLPSIE